MPIDLNTYHLPSEDNLDIASLSHLFDKMSESYKLFWFQAIVDQVGHENITFTYDDLVNNMIADAWYMVSEYRLNLGPSDNLEALVHYIHRLSGISSKEKKEKILAFLRSCDDSEFKKKKRNLTLHVPYRLQAPFMEQVRGKEWSVSERKLVEKINQEKRLIYYIRSISGLTTQIEITPAWYQYIYKNQEILRGFIQFHMITYLQRRNPSVPGIVNKLSPPKERNLERVKRYWKLIAEVMPVHDIYAGERLTPQNISIDHFVPWSYVVHDELWNLSPTTKSANSRKSSNLPAWNIYFPKLCQIEYLSYQAAWEYPKVQEEFVKCKKEHINSDEVQMRLYRPNLTKEIFTQNLEEILLPVYQSAHNMGFQEWMY